MAMGTYISIITLNVNALNSLTKEPRRAEWIKKKKTHIYAAYKRLASDLTTHTNWKWGDRKRYSCKWKSKESQGSNSHIRQNRF